MWCSSMENQNKEKMKELSSGSKGNVDLLWPPQLESILPEKTSLRGMEASFCVSASGISIYSFMEIYPQIWSDIKMKRKIYRFNVRYS